MESHQSDNLGGAAPGDGSSESENLGRLLGAASGGGGSENLGRLRQAAVSASGSARSAGNTRSPDEDATGAAQRVVEVVPAMENTEGGPASAPKRKRGRPKGSKNKPKTTTDSDAARKRARPAKSKASPKRSLVQALGQARDNVAPSTQSSLASTESVSQPGETSVVGAPATDTGDSEASVPSARTGTVQQTGSPATPSAGTRRNSLTRPPPIPGLYVDTLVAFSPEKEGWTKRKKAKDKYAGVGSAYLVGRVCRIVKGTMFQVQWLDSQYQRKDEHLNLSMIQRGNANYRSLHGSTSRVGWSHLCAVEEGEQIEVEGSIDDMEECVELFDPPMELPTTLAEVEAIKNMRFDPGAQSKEPEDLFQHSDGSTETYLLPQFKHLFEHSASASFFAYIPVSFWQQVLGERNSYARVHDIALAKPFSVDEIMTFLGVLFYMELVDKGEYSNYWGEQVETAIFGGNSVSLDAVMPIRRFKQLRQSFCFQCVEVNNANHDQAARIRPLLNLLKMTGPKYVSPGRNLALDEASVACRSKYGKPLIVYNPMKPTGKYHFRLYMLCCSTTWISLNFRLHCQSDVTERLAGVTTQAEAQALSDELAVSSSMRQCVLEVVRPVYGTRRIINSDNYYTSVQLLDAMRLKGLYGRGTVRKSSAHFPRHVVIEKKDCTRGTYRQAVSADRNTVAASWASTDSTKYEGGSL
uniref:PiggyBac transposable element-derived protein domain-containing protein n=1 Tax=Phytophthora ramorum TaxID=164328 RepID=H3GQV3_PHYRM